MSIFDWNWRKYCCLLIPTATGLAEKRPPSESGGFLTRMLAGTCTGVRNPPSPQTPRKNPASYPFDAGFFVVTSGLQSIREAAEFVRIRTSPTRILTNSATFRSSPLSVHVSMHLCVPQPIMFVDVTSSTNTHVGGVLDLHGNWVAKPIRTVSSNFSSHSALESPDIATKTGDMCTFLEPTKHGFVSLQVGGPVLLLQ